MTGLLSAIAAIYLASKMSSVRPDVAKGYELDIIAIAVLGGVSTSGGKRKSTWCNTCYYGNQVI